MNNEKLIEDINSKLLSGEISSITFVNMDDGRVTNIETEYCYISVYGDGETTISFNVSTLPEIVFCISALMFSCTEKINIMPSYGVKNGEIFYGEKFIHTAMVHFRKISQTDICHPKIGSTKLN